MPPGEKVQEQIIFVAEGDEPVYVLELTEPDPDDPTGETDQALDLTGKSLEFIVKANRDADDEDAMAKYTSSPEDGILIRLPATQGLADVQITAPATAAKGTFFWKVRVITDGHPLTPQLGPWKVVNA